MGPFADNGCRIKADLISLASNVRVGRLFQIGHETAVSIRGWSCGGFDDASSAVKHIIERE